MALDTTNLEQLFKIVNLAEGIEEEILIDIGDTVVSDFNSDLDSRSEWENMYNEWMKLAIQTMEDRTWPWDNAANVKYPLLTTAAMQFQARAYPTLVANANVVKAKVVGEDPDGSKAKKADRISKHMSYQLLEEMEDWDEDMDKLCFILPIAGTVFKKVYYDPLKETNVSELVLPKDLVINYWAKNLKSATTKTHVLYMTKNAVKANQLNGVFLDIDLNEASPQEFIIDQSSQENSGLTKPSQRENAPLVVLEQHRWWDLDDDGYEEPYIVTVEYSTKKVLRIVPGYSKDGVTSADGKILSIVPDEYFIKYSFIPNPDGGFYDLGFGALLGPLNETANTLINQLLDSGTINNLQSGFISKGIRMRAGDTSFTPGEWKTVQTTGDDLKKGIFPLPTKEPSSTLFQLLGTIVESGEKLASVAEIFVGKMPGQNTPATTTMATIEQGMKVFTAIYKRIYRSLTKEFRRLYQLNKLFLDKEKQFEVLDSMELMTVGESDYIGDDTDVRPAADPTMVSEMLRLTKAQALLELVPLGTLNVQEVTKRVLEAQDQPEIEKLLNQGPPPPDPKQMEAQMKMQMEESKAQLKMQEMQMKMQFEQQKNQMDMQVKEMELKFKALEMQLKAEGAQKQAMIDGAVAEQDMQIKQRQGEQKAQLSEQQFQQKQKQIKEQEKAKPKAETKGDK